MNQTVPVAGVRGRITRYVGNYYEYTKKGSAKTRFWVYELEIQEILKKWPEKKKRERRWVSSFFLFSLWESHTKTISHWDSLLLKKLFWPWLCTSPSCRKPYDSPRLPQHIKQPSHRAPYIYDQQKYTHINASTPGLPNHSFPFCMCNR